MIFFYDDYRQSGNVVAYQRVEKFESDSYKRHITKMLMKFPRFKSKVVKAYG